MISRPRPFAPRAPVSAYMLPARRRELDAFPANGTWKINHKELQSCFTRQMATPAQPVVKS
jgi:hypothetical protein